MRILIVGGGGREHALAWKLRCDDPNSELFAAPGNPGIAAIARCIPIDAGKLEELAACWLPARRAANVDPLVALRYE